MKVLAIRDLEKFSENAIVFPAFSLEVEMGSIVALYSSMNVRQTLLAMLFGKMPISRGTIAVNGESCAVKSKRYFSLVAFQFLEDGLYERLSVRESLVFYKKLYGSSLTVEEAIRLVQLERKANVRLAKLSYSEKRRIQFAKLLFQESAALMVFEEPDQNVDNETKLIYQQLVIWLTERGKSLLVLTGNMETALSVTNHIYRLDEKGLKAFDIREEDEEIGEVTAEGVQVGERPASEQELKRLQETRLTAELEPSESDSLQSDPSDPSDPSELGESDGEAPEQFSAEEGVIQFVRFEKIPTRMNDKMILFNPPEIDYIESSEGQSNLYIGGESYPTAFKINELEERLSRYGFFRCHRSYIVNLQKVREVITFTRNSYSLILDDAAKSSVPLSKTKMAELKEMMGLK
ncbi:LytTR family transcriptional regulator DNA-binding domain-containing protein [Paenibacillus sp. GCM10027627]|uniref:LytTR family transcriptional regulator DNA-binding domain-containing protein n=1 Tax=unclassified Paenibacillus TaxID=185978 RepID=UPI003640236A